MFVCQTHIIYNPFYTFSCTHIIYNSKFCIMCVTDPHMHTAIPVCEITHMGIENLISHMETFPVCIRGH